MKNSIVLVPFPFDDLSSNKVRPALCLTDPIGPHEHVILAFISSRIPDSPDPSDLIIRASDTDFEGTGLRVSSTLQLHRLMTVSVSMLKRQLGTIPDPLRKSVDRRLIEVSGMSSSVTSTQETAGVVQSQYLAALAMLRSAIAQCPDDIWTNSADDNPFWLIAYHAIFYTHLYVHPTEADFVPWERGRSGLQFMNETPEDQEPYTQADLLA